MNLETAHDFYKFIELLIKSIIKFWTLSNTLLIVEKHLMLLL